MDSPHTTPQTVRRIFLFFSRRTIEMADENDLDVGALEDFIAAAGEDDSKVEDDIDYVYSNNESNEPVPLPAKKTTGPFATLITLVNNGNADGVAAELARLIKEAKDLDPSVNAPSDENESNRINCPAGLLMPVVKRAVQSDLTERQRSEYTRILESLLQVGLNVHEVDRVKYSYGLLNEACEGRINVRPVIDILVRYGARINGDPAAPPWTPPPIVTAIQKKNTEALRALLHYGANIRKKYQQLHTPLFHAIIMKWPEGVALLLEKGGDQILFDIDSTGDNALILAVKLSDTPDGSKQAILRLLLAQPKLNASFINQNGKGKTALMVAVLLADGPTVALLLSDKRFVDTIDTITPHGSALSIALEEGINGGTAVLKETYAPIIQQLMQKNSSGGVLADTMIPLDDAILYPPLHYAIKTNASIQTVHEILTILSPPPSGGRRSGLTAAALLMQYTQGVRGISPLGVAIETDNLPMVKYLLEAGANISQPATMPTSPPWKVRKPTPVEYAAERGSLEIVTYLLGTGAIATIDLFTQILHSEEYHEENIPTLITLLFHEKGININQRDSASETPLMVAAAKSSYTVVQDLLAAGAADGIALTKQEGNPLSPTAYDMAASMETRLVIAPFLPKTDGPLFRGFLRDDFERFDNLFDEDVTVVNGKKVITKNLVDFVLCPFCFLPLQHNGGCMYIFEHNCMAERDRQKAAGYRSLPLVHEKLFQTYKDRKGNITVCHHCDRAGFTWPERVDQGQQLVGHEHIQLTTATPFIVPARAKRSPTANYYSREGCEQEGGGSHNEKILRIQVLLNFMCFLNEHFVGQISNERAHLLAREMFWEAPLHPYEYLVRSDFTPLFSPKELVYKGQKRRASRTPNETIAEIIAHIRETKKFIILCETPTELLPLPEGVVNTSVTEDRVYPNVPRYGTNAVDLAPLQEVTDDGTNFCFYDIRVNLGDGHKDGRPLYRFRHRQPGLRVHDHGADSLEMKELICASCLEDYLRGQITNAPDNTKKIACFAETCKGHFHPSELQGIISDEAYQAYKSYYNRFAPVIRGGRRADRDVINKEEYPSLVGAPVVVEQDTCPIRFRGGMSNTRRVRKTKKTRKAKRHSKTRRHK